MKPLQSNGSLISLVISKGFVRWTWDVSTVRMQQMLAYSMDMWTRPRWISKVLQTFWMRSVPRNMVILWFDSLIDLQPHPEFKTVFMCCLRFSWGRFFVLAVLCFLGKLDKCSLVTCGCLWFACYIDLLWFVLIYKGWRPSFCDLVRCLKVGEIKVGFLISNQLASLRWTPLEHPGDDLCIAQSYPGPSMYTCTYCWGTG